MARLEGKIALITGAASVPGLGAATAKRFAAEGATVVVSDIDLAGAQIVAQGIQDSGGTADAQHHDVTREADWDAVFAHIIETYQRIDILVNNAGIALLGTIAEITVDAWLKQNDVNLNSVFYGTQRAVKAMRRAGAGGSIINLSSVVGMVGVPGCGAYAASKGGVRLFSKTVALETARDKIRVNTVHPGMIMTNMQAVALRDNPEQYEIIAASIPMGHFGEPEDIANMNLFLASDESRYITGAEFVVDGGMIAM